MMKKVLSLLVSTAICLSLLSGCGEGAPEETQTEETTTVQTLSEEELDKMVQNMPEIVFVMSHHYDDTNILGFYITNTGEMKMYDFRKIAPDEIYELPDVYDRLEEATCSELDFGGWPNDDNITENDMTVISEDELNEYYKNLLSVNAAVEYIKLVRITMVIGHYRYYGVINNENGEKEIVLLDGRGEDYTYDSDDLTVIDLANWVRNKFPRSLNYNN